MRREIYDPGSRIPRLVEEGTQMEDVMRRDFTVNSLQFDFVDNVVEDLTGKGLSDIRDQRLRTIRDAKTLMLEDPLRALRALRFSNQLDFDLDTDLKEALSLETVRQRTLQLLSRERIVTEINKIFLHNHRNIRLSLTLSHLVDLGYFPIFFLGELEIDPSVPLRCLETLDLYLGSASLSASFSFDDLLTFNRSTNCLAGTRQKNCTLRSTPFFHS